MIKLISGMKAIIFLSLVFLFAFSSNALAAQRRAEELNTEGERLLKDGSMKSAFMKFREAADYDSLFAEPRYNLGLIYEKRGDGQTAREEFRAALSLSPQDPRIIKKVNEYIFRDVEAFLDSEDFEKATALIENLLVSEPRNPAFLIAQARVQIHLENWSRSRQILHEVIQLANNFAIPKDDPTIPVAHALYSLASFRDRQYYDAYVNIRRAKVLLGDRPHKLVDAILPEVAGDDNPVVKLWREGDALYDAGKLDKALEAYTKLLELHKPIKEVQDRIDHCNNMMKAAQLIKKGKRLVGNGEWKAAREIYGQIQGLGMDTKQIRETIEYIEKKIYQIEHPQEKVDLSDDTFEKNLQFLQESSLFGQIQDNLFETYQQAQDFYANGEFEQALGLYSSISLEKPDYEDVATKMQLCQQAINKRQTSLYATGVVVLIVLVVGCMLLNTFLRGLPKKRRDDAIRAVESAKSSGNWKKVISQSERLLNYVVNEKEVGKINLGMAQAHFKLGNYEKAVELAQFCLKVDHRNKAARTVLGKCYLERGVISDASIREYKELIQLEPGNLKLLRTLADYYVKKEMIDRDALDVYKRLLRLEPDNARILELIAVSYKEEGRVDAEAMTVYEDVITRDPDNIEFRQVLAAAYFQKELYDESLKECKLILHFDPENKDINKIFQQSYIKIGKLTECIIEYERLLEANSDSKFLKRSLDKLYEMRSLSPDFDNKGNDSDKQQNVGMAGSARAITVCRKCAHLNPATAETCKRCGATL
ncbi:MAG: hypothetical protein CVV64_02455 [Candidatus Wallbacteria bacterium HGW-Wallbacteria-1]|jgi:tetratricopeptide (TPR) repeat protein|uniref:Tetratricopeptide repeat protein n=1 Tax=Candidatus Wallbacteria bacterium HGW-Wallbacteria-1 TaxID=2013854 RepID=A0A2N1PVB8_9BACT|nr:MAG: hypothetical protein CVV64_02455 [Candidatus Wallbacteria bacterium HGW-Wallbacteria-1]